MWLLTTWSWVRSPQTACVIHVLNFKMNHEVLAFGKTFWKTNVRAMDVVFELSFFEAYVLHAHRQGVWKDWSRVEGYVQ